MTQCGRFFLRLDINIEFFCLARKKKEVKKRGRSNVTSVFFPLFLESREKRTTRPLVGKKRNKNVQLAWGSLLEMRTKRIAAEEDEEDCEKKKKIEKLAKGQSVLGR